MLSFLDLFQEIFQFNSHFSLSISNFFEDVSIKCHQVDIALYSFGKNLFTVEASFGDSCNIKYFNAILSFIVM